MSQIHLVLDSKETMARLLKGNFASLAAKLVIVAEKGLDIQGQNDVIFRNHQSGVEKPIKKSVLIRIIYTKGKDSGWGVSFDPSNEVKKRVKELVTWEFAKYAAPLGLPDLTVLVEFICDQN